MTAAEKGSRRRAVQRTRFRPDASVIAPALVVLLALAAVLLTRAPEPTGTAGAAAAATGGLVGHTTLVCPDSAAGRAAQTAVHLGSAPAPEGLELPVGGSVRQGPVVSAGQPVALPRGGLVDVPAAGGPVVDATGGAAAGLFGFRSDLAAGQTLAVADCATPRSQWWFTGAGAGLDHSSSLLLANVDAGPAVVDLRVLGPDGEVDTVSTTGITLAPHSVKRIELSGIAPQTDDLALSVHASRGRVVASVTDSFRPGPSGPQGQEWLAGTDLPSRTVRLAGLPAGSASTSLLVANPSDLEAVVDVRVAGRSGSFAPTGLDAISVAPGAITQVDLGSVLPRNEPVALRLRSRVPVVASVRSTAGKDHAYATPVMPLVGPAAAPLVAGADASVQLTAGAVAATVGVAAYDAHGHRLDGTTLTIPPTATQVWSPRRGAAYVVVTPSTDPAGGSVHGAVSYAGDGLATLPLTALPIRIDRPSVRPGLR